ncbi:outer membrane protein assembly factor BamB family protein [Prolixibacter bellariivorans]|nr:PQQ-binding-like beta-propeller repeat protein [Prolixibacter bellariivorans]
MRLINSLLAVSILLLTLFSCQTEPRPAVMFRADAQHSGYFASPDIDTLHGVKWKFQTNGYVFSSPAVFGDFVYFGSNDSTFYAVGKTSGREVWHYTTGGYIASSPAVTEESVFFISSDGYLYALERSSGKLQWRFNEGPEKHFSAPGVQGLQPKDEIIADPWDMYLSSPVWHKSVLYFGSGNGNFYAVDANSGMEKWHIATGEAIHNAPTIYNDMVIFGGWDRSLHAVSLETGREIWKFETGKDTVNYNQTGIQSSPVVWNDRIYFGCRDAHVYALDGMTGKLLWKRFNRYSWVINTPLVRDSTVYYGTSDTHRFIALNAMNGDSIYSKDIPAGYIFSSPVTTGKLIYFGGFNGTVHAVKAKTGEKVWEYRMDASVANRDSVLTADSEINNDFYARVFKTGYNAQTHEVAMKGLYSVGSVLSTPAVSDGVLYVGSSDGYLYALH